MLTIQSIAAVPPGGGGPASGAWLVEVVYSNGFKVNVVVDADNADEAMEKSVYVLDQLGYGSGDYVNLDPNSPVTITIATAPGGSGGEDGENDGDDGDGDGDEGDNGNGNEGEDGGGCLFEGTLVKMADKSQRSVNSIQPGESVLSRDEDGRLIPQRVVGVWKAPRAAMAILGLSNGTIVQTSLRQPLVMHDGKRRKVRHIGKGMHLRSTGKDGVTINSYYIVKQVRSAGETASRKISSIGMAYWLRTENRRPVVLAADIDTSTDPREKD